MYVRWAVFSIRVWLLKRKYGMRTWRPFSVRQRAAAMEDV